MVECILVGAHGKGGDDGSGAILGFAIVGELRVVWAGAVKVGEGVGEGGVDGLGEGGGEDC